MDPITTRLSTDRGGNAPAGALKHKATKTKGDPTGPSSTDFSVHVARVVGPIVGSTAVLTALAYYFGYTFTNARATYFGIDPSTLGFSPTDYILRSADALFIPLGAILVLGLGCLTVDGYVRTLMTADQHLTALSRVVRSCQVAGGVIFCIGVYAAFSPLPFNAYYLIPPASPGIGIVSLAYGTWVLRRLDSHKTHRLAGEPSSRHASVTLVILIALLSLFWTASEYASALGSGRAQDLAANLEARPGVVILSTRPLALTGSGVTVTDLDQDRGAYRYKYSGLRLLIRSRGDYFLVPDDWTRSNGVAFVVPDVPTLLFEFTPT